MPEKFLQPVDPGICPDCGGVLPAGGKGRCFRCLWNVSFGAGFEDTEAETGETAWAHLGDYDLYGEIAHGGMGVVYLARQRRLGRHVAVKVLRGGAFADSAARRRFRREAESAGRLQHPGVVAVHDVGEDQGVCWFSMDYVPGENLAQRVQKRPLEAAAAAACVRLVAEAIQHAHDHGVLHRDLKPSNILMGMDDQPKVTDFGLARQLEDATGAKVAALTQSKETMGSPGYAAPEQALHGVAQVAADVYGLGAVLYHTLTGRAPFVGPTLDSILLQLRDTDPVPIRRLNPTVPQDLETICLKCLEKQPGRRYASAAQVAEDLLRFEKGEVLLARPVGRVGKAMRWCRRQPVPAALAAALVLAVAVGVAGIFHQWQRAESKAMAEVRQRELAQQGERSAQLRRYTAGVYAASQALLEDDNGRAGDLLERLIPAPGGEDFRGPEWHLLQHRITSQELNKFEGHPWIVSCLAASPDGRLLASGGWSEKGAAAGQSTFFVWNPMTGETVFKGPPGTGSVRSVQFTTDGRELMISAGGQTRFWSSRDWTPTGRKVTGTYAAMAHRKLWLVTTEDRREGQSSCLVWYDLEKLHEFRRIPLPGTLKLPTFSPDGQWLAVVDGDGNISLVPAERDGPTRHFPTKKRINGFTFSPDGRWLAACGGGWEVMLWDLQAPIAAEKQVSPAPDGQDSNKRKGSENAPFSPENKPLLLSGHRMDVKGAAFSPKGDQLITTGSDRTIRFWDAPDWTPAGALRGHKDEVWCALPDASGRWLATGSKDKTVRLWPTHPPVPTPGPPHYVSQPAVWSRDSRKILTSQRGSASIVNDLTRGMASQKLLFTARAADPRGHWSRFAEDPGRLEWLDDSGQITRRVELEGSPRILLRKIASKPEPVPMISMSWAANGDRFALGLAGEKVGVWDSKSGQRLALLDCPPVDDNISLPLALSDDGKMVAFSSSSTAAIYLVALDTMNALQLNGHSGHITTLAFSPDGHQLASGGVDATIRLWDTATGAVVAAMHGHFQDVNCVAYAPGGKTLASLGNFECVRLWNLETATEMVTLYTKEAQTFLAFSPDGKWLAVNQGDPNYFGAPELERLLMLPVGP